MLKNICISIRKYSHVSSSVQCFGDEPLVERLHDYIDKVYICKENDCSYIIGGNLTNNTSNLSVDYYNDFFFFASSKYCYFSFHLYRLFSNQVPDGPIFGRVPLYWESKAEGLNNHE